MKLMDLLNDNELNENKYSVHVNMGRKVGDITLKVNAKDEKEARELIAKGLKNPKDIKKVVKEGILNEAKRQKIKTRFGDFSIEHDENPTAPGYSPEYFLEVKFNGEYLGHFIIAGDPRDKGAKGNVSVHLGKKQVKLKHDK